MLRRVCKVGPWNHKASAVDVLSHAIVNSEFVSPLVQPSQGELVEPVINHKLNIDPHCPDVWMTPGSDVSIR